MKLAIHRRCACGCGGITNSGKRFRSGHNANRKGVKISEQSKKKMSLAHIGQNGWKHSKETKLKMSLTKLAKPHPNDEYCEAWRDNEYKKDLMKDYCENEDCRGGYKQLNDHHINLNKKDCRPHNVMTLCNSCHTSLHWKLSGKEIANYKEFVTIIRQDRITYIHKVTRKKIILKRRLKLCLYAR